MKRYRNWVKENPDWKKKAKKKQLLNKLKGNITDLTPMDGIDDKEFDEEDR